MRRILLRLLLLAVFFNTAVGMPLHEAEHLRQSGPDAAHAWSLLEADDNTDPIGHDTEAQALCSWCQAFAQQATALTAPPVDRVSGAEPAAPLGSRPVVAFVPDPDHWPFASRDPPALA
jgi:hypothetical protein